MRLNHNRKSTFAASPVLSGEIGDCQPEFGCCSNGVEEGIELYRLSEVAIRVQEVGVPNVPFRVGGRQYGNRDGAEVRVFFYRSENRPGIRFGQVEIEKNKSGSGSVLIGRSLPQKPEGLFTVRGDR